MCIECWNSYGSPAIWNENVANAVELIDKEELEYVPDLNSDDPGRDREIIYIVVDDWNISNESLSRCFISTPTQQQLFDLLLAMNEQERASVLAKVEGLW